MKISLVSVLAAGCALVLSGPAFAQEPVQLSAHDMDAVTAGSFTPIVIAGGTANAFAAGKYFAATSTSSFGLVKELDHTNLSVSGARSASASY